MLSIRFAEDSEHEWWVSSTVFERLFSSAIAHAQIPAALEEWRYIAAANGGLSFDEDEQDARDALMNGLREAAEAELARLGSVDLQSADGTYKISLEKLLAIGRG
jgi:hypothetical protein